MTSPESEAPKEISGRPPATAQQAAEQVALACRTLAWFGHEDLTLGHASVRGPEGHTIYIKRKGRALREVRPDDVMPISLDEEEGYLAPGAHLETVMHTEAYRGRPDIGAAVHTHPQCAIALGASGTSLALISHDGLLFPEGVPVFDGTAGLVTTPEHGKAVAQTLGLGRAVLLRNHGIFAVGEDIRWAVLAAVTLERAARLQVAASSLGGMVPISSEVAAQLSGTKYSDDFTDEYWMAWCRMVGAAELTGPASAAGGYV